ncbi:hypothetical protein D6201_12755 [Aurantiacibacter aquimixticola]|uniref:Uncharacterized protein n=2 Tax=Aurantiacibacter aquimixticola TaxID=1958945 RepID=A0A419RNH1_9SPHN|nr:hypothetical protein D6201_12755 [Aurantiacibacter aquimixticola]
MRLHPVALAVLGGFFAGGGGALLIVLASNLWSAGNAAIFIVCAAIAFATLLTGLMPLFVTQERTATGEDIATALTAATGQERSHLLAAIENRLTSKLWLKPMTTFELAVVFENVRGQHGDQARHRQHFEQRGKIEQQRFIGALESIIGAPEEKGQGAL